MRVRLAHGAVRKVSGKMLADHARIFAHYENRRFWVCVGIIH
jgi:hypothetical protein